MKRIALITAVLTGCAGQRQPTILVEGVPRQLGDRTGGETTPGGRFAWYAAEELDGIVRNHARANDVRFDFRGTTPQFWVPRDRKFMARASYSSGIGRPYL